MIKFFDSELYNAQFMRVLGNIPYQAADLGECLKAINKMPANRETWFTNWFAQATDNLERASFAKTQGLDHMAYTNFLRAATYFRSAYFFLEDLPEDPRIIQALDKSISAFAAATQYMKYKVRQLKISHKNYSLPAYLYTIDDKPCATIITCAGGDGTKEEAFITASEALAYGYNCVCFEGPGQGMVLRKMGITFEPEWDLVVASVIENISQFREINLEKIIYYGKSFGGYLGARAICNEKRIAACILDPGQYDAGANIKALLHNSPNKESAIKAINELISQNPDSDLAFKLNSRLWRYGTNNLEDFIENIKQFTLEGLVQNIRCPILILDNEEEYLSKGQAKILYDQLNSHKYYHLFAAKEQTGGHCQPLSPQKTYEYIFNWLDTIIK